MKDSAGFTFANVQQQNVEEQYQRMGAHFDELWLITEQMQQLVHTDEWDYGDAGRVMPGTYSPQFTVGMRGSKSYFILTQKGFDLPEGESLIEKMVQGLEKMEYPYTRSGPDSTGTVEEVWAELPNGGGVIYREHVNGRGLLDVYTGLFWGDDRLLRAERADRPYERPPEPSLPGENPEFPAWDVPKR